MGKKKFGLIYAVCTLFPAAVNIAYFIAMQIVSPATFLGGLFSFSAVWLAAGLFFIALFVFRKKISRKNIPLCGRYAAVAVVSIGIIICTVNLICITHPRLSDGTERVRYVIVLGGGITKDAELTDTVRIRLKKAAEYLNSHMEAKAIVTGGQGPFSPCPEADVLKAELAALGIAEERILAEDRAKDTIQNFEYSARLAAAADGITTEEVLNSPVAVVTSDFHISRAERLAGRIGYKDVYGVASKTPALFIPNCYGREICAWIKLNLRILFTGRPSVLK